jgi:preprotein translocase YajC subunit
MNIAYAMGQGGAGAPGGSGGFASFIPLILMFVIFYFLLIRPQQKKTKEHRQMIDNLRTGDRIVTSGGLHGRITGVSESALTVEIAEKVRVKVNRGSVSAIMQTTPPRPRPKKTRKPKPTAAKPKFESFSPKKPHCHRTLDPFDPRPPAVGAGVRRRLGLWRVDHERNKALKNLSWRLTVIAAVIVAAVIYVIPTFQPGVWPHKKINLGLDLQGGMHLVLEVDADKAVENTIERVGQEMRELLKKEADPHPGYRTRGDRQVGRHVGRGGQHQRFDELLDEEFRDLRIADRTVTDNGVSEIVLDIPDKEADHIRKLAVDQALETIRNRIDQFGVSEPDIRIQGERRILIQLAGHQGHPAGQRTDRQNRPAGV